MFKKIFMPFVLMASLAVSGAGRAEGQADYFPLASGMTWAYGDSFHVVRVGGMMKSLPPIYIVDYTGQKRYFIKQDDGKVLEWRDGKRRLLYDFGAKPGTSWTIEPLGDGFEILDGTVVTVLDVSETVTTPHGTFKGCVHLGMRPRAGLADAGITDAWFAPGVGLVKWSEVWIGGVRSFSLTRFSTGTSSARLKLELTTDREVYGPGDTVSARYRLVNTTKDTLKLMFRSGQRYDFVLDGPNGRVWGWSNNRAFIQVLGAQALPPGDTLEVREAFVIAGTDGEGTYVLTGFMTVTPDAAGALSREETEVRVKFTVGRTAEVRVPPDPSSGSLKGDFNRDRRVDFEDFFAFAAGFGKRSGEAGFDRAFDLDGDGSVGMTDFFAFADAFGKAQ